MRTKYVFLLVLLIDLIIAYSFDSPAGPVSAQAPDSLQIYAQQCDQAIGITVPSFSCDAGTPVLTTHLTPSTAAYPNGDCDRPNRLHGLCDPGSKFQVLSTTTQDAYAVAHCRKMGNPSGFYGDIAVIQHNTRNGATCFYQALGTLYSEVKAPSQGLSAWDPDPLRPGKWQPPSTTASQDCGACHDNGPLIRSPYLTQVTGPNRLPGAGDISFNKNQPYYFVGADFASWKAYKVEVAGNICTTCHRMGTNNLPGQRGTALVFGMQATADDWVPSDHPNFSPFAEDSKNPHSPDSPIWMTPGQTFFDPTNAKAALDIRNCALLRTANPLPNLPECKITQFTGSTETLLGNLVWQFSGNPNVWYQIGSPAESLVAGGNTLYAISPDDGSIWRYEGSPFVWTQIGLPGYQFVANNTKLYGLSPDKSGVWQFSGNPNVWYQIGSPAESLVAGGNTLYAISPGDGSIWRYEGRPFVWTQIGLPGYQFVANNTTLYGLSPDKSGVWQFSGNPNVWYQIGSPAESLVAGGNTLYAISPDDGSVWRYEGRPFVWTQIGLPGYQFVANNTKLYGLSPDKSGVWQFSGNPNVWYQIGSPAESLVAGGNTLYAISPDN